MSKGRQDGKKKKAENAQSGPAQCLLLESVFGIRSDTCTAAAYDLDAYVDDTSRPLSLLNETKGNTRKSAIGSLRPAHLDHMLNAVFCRPFRPCFEAGIEPFILDLAWRGNIPQVKERYVRKRKGLGFDHFLKVTISRLSL
ncbi:uncharacterized protein SPSK_08029 [Sporothrix schenckii 1099-18]|uniref:Uncharacterized protein n=1 Tax=Sporothrix schenckii 1099-18 TaxID=1397361 RepID=A0A0F2MFI1_SPOSC|nr:uncharacterized protein SPSK_08029 [Sporothrix schenckii 1099-18]KJR88397.1 hypothetical protein SPSK_08029 [Sporothrix schenckii 1099-18]